MNYNPHTVNLSRSEAIQALADGKKIKHIYFDEEEYIYQKDNYYYDENGYAFLPEMFWRYRDTDRWQTGWLVIAKD